MIYENGIPKTLLTDAGFVSLSDSKYHYYLQDHQGNNRVVVDENGTVEEVNQYYPFGGTFASTSSVQPYKYNGKELDRKGGLDWHDYGARHYDVALGRWHAVDPMTEKSYNWSPYGYCKNNPILRVDIDGMYDYTIDKLGYISKTGKEGNDRLFSSNKNVKPIKIHNGEVLEGMLKMEKDFMNPGKVIYNSTNNMEDATNIFKFAADNTSVEWKLDIYDNNGSTTAVVGTKHYEDRVFSDVQKELNVKGEKVFDLHSHPYNNMASENDLDALRINTGAIYHKDTATMFFYNKQSKHIINGQFFDIEIKSGSDIWNIIQRHLK